MAKRYPTVLSIAGSDSIGGAGIQADIKTCCALNTYAMTAITAITAQNTTGVRCFAATAPDLLRAQLEAVFDDVEPDAVKIGMVPDAASVEVIADALRRYRVQNVVLDPVLIATSGDALNDGNTQAALMQKLLPLALIVTPNLPEAKQLGITGAVGSTATLIKGGHMDADAAMLVDTLYLPDGYTVQMKHRRVDTRNTHGTGCSLSTAIAAFLANGEDLTDAVVKAVSAVHHAIVAGANYEFGSPDGHGPINHFVMNKA